jgi:hypothetical protein
MVKSGEAKRRLAGAIYQALDAEAEREALEAFVDPACARACASRTLNSAGSHPRSPPSSRFW